LDTLIDIADSRGIGDNNPPGKVELERAAELTTKATDWLADCLEITDTDMAKEANGFVAKLKDSRKELVAAQKVEIKPLDEAIAEVKVKYREPVTKIDAALGELATLSGAWLVKERDRIAAEKAAQEAEARRLREEAERAERERIEAQRRLDDERRRMAAEEEERKRAAAAQEQTELERVAAESAAQADLERVEAERQLAARVAAAAEEKVKAAKEAEHLAARKTETAAIKSEPGRRAMTLRTYWSAVIVDETAAIESYRDNPAVRKATLAAVFQVANEAARAAKDESKAPPGVRFVKEERAQ
jgi:multidrug efflux pump subunit AcrA (membrane-fusion protein)